MTIQRYDIGRRFASAVVHNCTVYLAGEVAEDTTQDVRGQTAQVLRQIDAQLKAVGSDKTKLLSVQVFLSDIRFFDAMNEAWEAWLDREHAPVRATIEARLATPGYLVEMMAIAAL
ncbi:MAG: RidA family protein [Myxococcaceae bacterium]|nr:RidA family protein [Myxococcaceae bacterium]